MSIPKTSFGEIALDFGKALGEERYTDAYLMLSEKLKKTHSPGILRSEYLDLFIEDGDLPIEIELLEEIDYVEYDNPLYLGSAYVSISGYFKNDDIGRWNEAVIVDVISEKGKAVIDNLEWGRP